MRLPTQSERKCKIKGDLKTTHNAFPITEPGKTQTDLDRIRNNFEKNICNLRKKVILKAKSKFSERDQNFSKEKTFQKKR